MLPRAIADEPTPAPNSSFPTLLALVALSPGLTRRLPLWGRVLVRLTAFVCLTVAVARHPRLPAQPRLRPPAHRHPPLGAGDRGPPGIASMAVLAVAAVRLVVVLEGKPREDPDRLRPDRGRDLRLRGTARSPPWCSSCRCADCSRRRAWSRSCWAWRCRARSPTCSPASRWGSSGPTRPATLIWVEGAIEGVVLEVNWRSTQLATGDRNVAIIPNSVIAKARLINRSAPHYRCAATSLTVRLDAAVPPETCVAPLLAARDDVPHARAHARAHRGLHGPGRRRQQLRDRFRRGRHVDVAGRARAELFREIHRHLRFGGITLAVPNTGSVPWRGHVRDGGPGAAFRSLRRLPGQGSQRAS